MVNSAWMDVLACRAPVVDSTGFTPRSVVPPRPGDGGRGGRLGWRRLQAEAGAQAAVVDDERRIPLVAHLDEFPHQGHEHAGGLEHPDGQWGEPDVAPQLLGAALRQRAQRRRGFAGQHPGAAVGVVVGAAQGREPGGHVRGVVVAVHRVRVNGQAHRLARQRGGPVPVAHEAGDRPRAVEIRGASARRQHIAPLVRGEQGFGHAGANLALAAAGLHGRVLVQRAPIRPAQHIDVVQHHQARFYPRRGGDQVVHQARQRRGPHRRVVRRVHAVIERARALGGAQAEGGVERVPGHGLDARRHALGRALGHAHPFAFAHELLRQEGPHLAGAEQDVEVFCHGRLPV